MEPPSSSLVMGRTGTAPGTAPGFAAGGMWPLRDAPASPSAGSASLLHRGGLSLWSRCGWSRGRGAVQAALPRLKTPSAPFWWGSHCSPRCLPDRGAAGGTQPEPPVPVSAHQGGRAASAEKENHVQHWFFCVAKERAGIRSPRSCRAPCPGLPLSLLSGNSVGLGNWRLRGKAWGVGDEKENLVGQGWGTRLEDWRDALLRWKLEHRELTGPGIDPPKAAPWPCCLPTPPAPAAGLPTVALTASEHRTPPK